METCSLLDLVGSHLDTSSSMVFCGTGWSHMVNHCPQRKMIKLGCKGTTFLELVVCTVYMYDSMSIKSNICMNRISMLFCWCMYHLMQNRYGVIGQNRKRVRERERQEIWMWGEVRSGRQTLTDRDCESEIELCKMQVSTCISYKESLQWNQVSTKTQKEHFISISLLHDWY